MGPLPSLAVVVSARFLVYSMLIRSLPPLLMLPALLLVPPSRLRLPFLRHLAPFLGIHACSIRDITVCSTFLLPLAALLAAVMTPPFRLALRLPLLCL